MRPLALFASKDYWSVLQQKNGRFKKSRTFESFMNDEGRPFEIGYQEQVSNHLKQLLLRAVVVSVEEKAIKRSSGRDQKDE